MLRLTERVVTMTAPNRNCQLYSFCHLGQSQHSPTLSPAVPLFTSIYASVGLSADFPEYLVRPSPKTFQQLYYIQASSSRPKKENNNNNKRI
jgi:hypothetical protein